MSASETVKRLDTYSQAEHIAHLEAARVRTEARKQARRERARVAAARLRDAATPLHEGEGSGRAAVEPKTQATRSHASSSGPQSTRGEA